jgi:hypothetical protein
MAPACGRAVFSPSRIGAFLLQSALVLVAAVAACLPPDCCPAWYMTQSCTVATSPCIYFGQANTDTSRVASIFKY